MCGLNGVLAYNISANHPDPRELIATRDHMRSRGPDGFGEWWNEDRRLGLGHQRLSIIDLSDGGHQPMESACGRYVVVYNGEIYNYPELREELERQGRVLRTNSDTEVLVQLFQSAGHHFVHQLALIRLGE